MIFESFGGWIDQHPHKDNMCSIYKLDFANGKGKGALNPIYSQHVVAILIGIGLERVGVGATCKQ